jgi:hypothetical protein
MTAVLAHVLLDYVSWTKLPSRERVVRRIWRECDVVEERDTELHRLGPGIWIPDCARQRHSIRRTRVRSPRAVEYLTAYHGPTQPLPGRGSRPPTASAAPSKPWLGATAVLTTGRLRQSGYA